MNKPTNSINPKIKKPRTIDSKKPKPIDSITKNRLNFMWQAFQLLVEKIKNSNETKHNSYPSNSLEKCYLTPDIKDDNQNKALSSLSRLYIQNMTKLSRKQCARLGPLVKRRVCKKCGVALVEKKTLEKRIKDLKVPNQEKLANKEIQISTCLECGFQRSFDYDDDSKWIHRSTSFCPDPAWRKNISDDC